MYRIVSIERQGNSVFKNEYEYPELKEAKEKYNEEKENKDIVDIRLWYCIELERFCKRNITQ